jgi:rhodanese-related sulfurtransferase
MNKLSILLLTSLLIIVGCKPSEKQSKSAEIVEVASTTEASFEDISLEEAKNMISEMSDLIVVDVRTPQEISQGKIDGALEIDFLNENFSSEINKLDKNKKYLLYCRSGNRSGQALQMMKENGFIWARNMMGGYSAWSSANK